MPESNTVICLADGIIAGETKKALIWLKKSMFETDKITKFFTGSTENPVYPPVELSQLLQHNDKFFNYLANCNPILNQLFVKLIFPATENDIQKVYPT